MPHSTPYLLPFEGLLKSLHLQGFSIGVDTHLRIQQLLNAWEGEEAQDLQALKVQLGVLLARDEEEQQRFYRLFDAYVAQFEYDPELRNRRNPPPPPSWWETHGLKLLFGVLALLAVLGSAYGWLASQQGITPRLAFQQQPGTYRVWLEDQSEIFSLAPFWEDSIVERQWLVADTLLKEEEVVSVDLQSSGLHQLQLVVRSLAEVDTLTANLQLKPISRLSISASLRGKQRNLQARIIQVPPDTSESPVLREKLRAFSPFTYPESYQWNLGDGKSATEDVVVHTYEAGSYEVTLAVTQLTKDTKTGEILHKAKLRDSHNLVIEQEESPVDVEPVQFGYRELEWDESILELLKPKEAPTWPYWLTALALVLYGLYELYLSLTRRPMLDTSERGPPSHQELKLDRPSVRLFDSDAFEEAALRLRARQQGDVLELDLEGTVQATIDAGGLPDIAWAHTEQAPQYLFLIEQLSYEDQLATYYSELVWELHGRDISAEFFFYEEDLRGFWKDRSRPETEVELGAACGRV